MSSGDPMRDSLPTDEFMTPADYLDIDFSIGSPLTSAFNAPPPVWMAGTQNDHHQLEQQLNLYPNPLSPVEKASLDCLYLPPSFSSTDSKPEAGTLVAPLGPETEAGAERGAHELSDTIYLDPDIFKVTEDNFQGYKDQDYRLSDYEISLNSAPDPMMQGNNFHFSSSDSTFNGIQSAVDDGPMGTHEPSFSSLGTNGMPLDHDPFDQNLEFGLDSFGLPMYQQGPLPPLPQSILENVYIPEFDEFAANMVLYRDTTSDSDPAPASVPLSLPVIQTLQREHLSLTDDLPGDLSQLDEFAASDYEATDQDSFSAQQDL
jgi:hypothetical protein